MCVKWQRSAPIEKVVQCDMMLFMEQLGRLRILQKMQCID
jgi:hypothetical protein